MATVEELLETLISVEESSASSQSSNMELIKQSLTEIKNGYEADNTTPNYLRSGLNDLKFGYTSEQVQQNNTLFYSDVVAIKELVTYQFVFFGVVIGFFLIWAIVKGLFKNVSH